MRPSRKSPRPEPEIRFRPRVLHRGEIALGPGKADLLAAIAVDGSISRAAKQLGMSYMRAWTLVKIMNQSFRGPLVAVDRGGPRGGAAHLTPLGRDVLKLYNGMIAKSEAATRALWQNLRRHLK
ncbi:MAG TPA: LysR family transcriptional regulator [Lacunisphaera sp.]